MPIELPFHIEVLNGIESVGREAWDACFPGEPERFDYLLAVEHAGLPGFDWFYLIAKDAAGR